MLRFTQKLYNKTKVKKVKELTSLVGVPVQPRWREMLLKLCDDVLKEIQTIPKGVFYRQVTENNFKFFQSVIQKHDDYEMVESIIDRGQVEQLIIMFEDELELIPVMAENKPWIVTEDSALEAKEHYENGDDYDIPDGHKPTIPLEFKTWNGIYNVTLTPEEILEMEKKEVPKDKK